MVRIKSRYVLSELVFGTEKRYRINTYKVQEAINNVVEQIHGYDGLAKVSIGLKVKYLNDYTRMVMITCRRDHHQLLLSALPFVTSLELKQPDQKGYQPVSCFFNTLHCAGTIRCCQKKLIKLNLRKKEEFLKEAKSPEERKRIEEAFRDAESSEDEDE